MSEKSEQEGRYWMSKARTPGFLESGFALGPSDLIVCERASREALEIVGLAALPHPSPLLGSRWGWVKVWASPHPPSRAASPNPTCLLGPCNSQSPLKEREKDPKRSKRPSGPTRVRLALSRPYLPQMMLVLT